MIPPPPRSTLFPYTTLFRSSHRQSRRRQWSLQARTGWTCWSPRVVAAWVARAYTPSRTGAPKIDMPRSSRSFAERVLESQRASSGCIRSESIRRRFAGAIFLSPRSAGARMDLDVKGKRVVVADGSRGIGRSIALAFAHGGAKVSICARGADALESTKKEIAVTGAFAHAETCDLSNEAEIAR